MLSENREKFKKIEIKTGEFFSKLGLTPNQYTLISLFFAILALYFLIDIDLILALIFFLLATLLDFIDGAVARFTQRETKKGAYLDTICDRYVEGIILLGFLLGCAVLASLLNNGGHAIDSTYQTLIQNNPAYHISTYRTIFCLFCLL